MYICPRNSMVCKWTSCQCIHSLCAGLAHGSRGRGSNMSPGWEILSHCWGWIPSGQLLVPTGKNRAWKTLIYTFAKPTVSLLTYHSSLLVLLSWPSWQASCRFRQDSLRPRKLGKRVKMSKEGRKKEKESLTTSTAFSSKGRRAVKPLQCNPNTSGKCSKAATMKTEKKPQKSQNISLPLQ